MLVTFIVGVSCSPVLTWWLFVSLLPSCSIVCNFYCQYCCYLCYCFLLYYSPISHIYDHHYPHQTTSKHNPTSPTPNYTHQQHYIQSPSTSLSKSIIVIVYTHSHIVIICVVYFLIFLMLLLSPCVKYFKLKIIVIAHIYAPHVRQSSSPIKYALQHPVYVYPPVQIVPLDSPSHPTTVTCYAPYKSNPTHSTP